MKKIMAKIKNKMRWTSHEIIKDREGWRSYTRFNLLRFYNIPIFIKGIKKRKYLKNNKGEIIW